MNNEPPFNGYDDEPTMAPGEPQPMSTNHKFPYAINARYRCLGLLGQGSSGAVYKAFDSQLQREVAIKFIHRHQHEERTRLLNEARVLAQLEHPNICKVFEVAEEGQAVYLVMSYVNGPHLNQWREQFSQNQLISIIADIAGALHTAHQQGIVHCDIKPSNIVLRQTENAVQPVLVDFGIAHASHSSASISGAGTEHYMAPERATPEAGSAQALTPAIDIYALGATLRFVLTGSHAGTVDALSDDLKRIIEHCLADDAHARYQSAETLQQDLIAYLNCRSISLRRSPLYKTKRLWQRSPWFRGTSTAAIGLALIAIIGVNFYQHAMNQRQLEQLNISEQVVQREYQIEAIYRSPLHPVNDELQQLQTDAERWYQQAGEQSTWLAAAQYAAAGRLFYQLYENDRALSSLGRAWEMGEHSDRTATAYALTLNRYHFDAKRRARALPSAEDRDAAIEEAFDTYAVSALEILDQVDRIQLPRDYARAIRLYLTDEPMQALTLLRRGNFPSWFYQRYELMLEISDELIQDILDDHREGDYIALLHTHEEAYTELVKRVPSYLPGYFLRVTTLFSLQVTRENQHQDYDETAKSWIDSAPGLLDAMGDIDAKHPEYLFARGRYHTLLSYRYHLTDLPTSYHLSRGARFFELSLRQSASRQWAEYRTTAIIRGILGHYDNYLNYHRNRGEPAPNLLARYHVILNQLPEVYHGDQYYTNLGNAYTVEAHFAQSYDQRNYYFALADKAYGEGLKRSPGWIGLQTNYARVLNSWGDKLTVDEAIPVRQRAQELIAPALERLPDNPAVQYNIGSLHMSQAADLRQAGDTELAAEYFAIADQAFAKVVELAPQLDIGRQLWSDVYLYFNDYLPEPLGAEERANKVMEILNLEASSLEHSPMSFVREMVLLYQRHKETRDPDILNQLEQVVKQSLNGPNSGVATGYAARTLIYMSLHSDDAEKVSEWRAMANQYFADELPEQHSLFRIEDNATVLMGKFAQVLNARNDQDKQRALDDLADACAISSEMYQQGYLKYVYLENSMHAWRTIEAHSGVECSAPGGI